MLHCINDHHRNEKKVSKLFVSTTNMGNFFIELGWWNGRRCLMKWHGIILITSWLMIYRSVLFMYVRYIIITNSNTSSLCTCLWNIWVSSSFFFLFFSLFGWAIWIDVNQFYILVIDLWLWKWDWMTCMKQQTKTF